MKIITPRSYCTIFLYSPIPGRRRDVENWKNVRKTNADHNNNIITIVRRENNAETSREYALGRTRRGGFRVYSRVGASPNVLYVIFSIKMFEGGEGAEIKRSKINYLRFSRNARHRL